MIMTASTNVDASRVNPLIDAPQTPFMTLPFCNITTEDLKEGVLEGIKRQKEEIRHIVENPENPTFENTIVALDRSGRLLGKSLLALSNLEAAIGSDDLMNAMTEVTPILSAHEADMLLDEGLWERIRTVYDARDSRQDLTDEDRRLLSETYLSYALNGANLKGEDRDRYRRLNSELSELTVKFSQNVTNDMKNPERRLWLTEDQLEGIPSSVRAAARAEAKEILEAEGKSDDGSLYLFTVFYPSYSPFMKYAALRPLREKLYKMYCSRNAGGEYDNTQILKDIANIRLEKANLLGFDTFADFKLQQTMAGNKENVYKMLEELRENYTPALKKEFEEIEAFARETEGNDFRLQPWDYSFWADSLKNSRYAFNDEDMKPYFELESTIKGVFGLATRLYGYKFKENKKIATYHPDVKAYEVFGPEGRMLGILYTDFFYRPGKSPGAWMTEFRGEEKDDAGVKTIPLISIVCNFSKPVGKDPVLLTPGEVETFLHEFGHALHGLSADTKYATLSGTNVYHDFVELFSQFNENFLTQQEFLDSFARHYKTGKKMPHELVDKFIRASQFGAAYACLRQLGFGYLDMAYHTITEPLRASSSTGDFERVAVEPVQMFDVVDGCYIAPSFGHIFGGGYAAGYYGYKWSEELDADAFSAFIENGIFDKATAGRFRKMLSAGGTVDPMTLYLEFRGKKPTVDALLVRDGIKR